MNEGRGGGEECVCVCVCVCERERACVVFYILNKLPTNYFIHSQYLNIIQESPSRQDNSSANQECPMAAIGPEESLRYSQESLPDLTLALTFPQYFVLRHTQFLFFPQSAVQLPQANRTFHKVIVFNL
jgi:hypothetical protein